MLAWAIGVLSIRKFTGFLWTSSPSTHLVRLFVCWKGKLTHVIYLRKRLTCFRAWGVPSRMGLRFLYSLRPRQPFLDVVLAYLLEPNFNF